MYSSHCSIPVSGKVRLALDRVHQSLQFPFQISQKNGRIRLVLLTKSSTLLDVGHEDVGMFFETVDFEPASEYCDIIVGVCRRVCLHRLV